MRKHLKKGFTLIELLVVLMLMGLITTAVVMALRPVTQIYADINYKYDEENGSITLFDFINGDIRYATDVQVISTDTDAMPSPGDFKSFILLSNAVRPNSVKKARGYAQFGKTDNPSNRGYCVSESILGENDFQFSLASYNIRLHSEAITIKATGHPMRENAARNGFEPNTRKPYEFNETIQFVNMQRSDQLPEMNGTLSVSAYDDSKPYTWILYSKPSDLAGSGGSKVKNPGKFGDPTYNKKGTKTVNYGATVNTLTVIFQDTLTTPCHYKFTNPSDGITVMNADGSPYHGGVDVGGDMTINVNIPAGKVFNVYESGVSTPFYTCTDAELAAGSMTVYIYDNDAHTTPYSMPGQYANPKTLNVHYVPVEGEDPSYGVYVRDAAGVDKATSYTFAQQYGGTITNYLGKNGNVNMTANGEEKVLTLDFMMDASKVHLYWSKNGGSPLLADFGVYGSDDMANEGDSMDIYVYGGVVYNTREEIPIPEALNKNILVHFMYEANRPDCAGLAFVDTDKMKSSTTTSRGQIPDNVNSWDNNCLVIEGAGNFDVTVTIIKEAGTVDIYNKDRWNNSKSGNTLISLDKDSPEEIWIYSGVAYTSKTDVPGYREINKDIVVHYLQGNDTFNGIYVQDQDAYTEALKFDGEFIADGGFKCAWGDGDFDSTVTIVTDGGVAGLFMKDTYSESPAGNGVATLNQDSPGEIWVYNGRMYATADEANAKRDKDNSGEGVDISASWEGNTNNWGNANWSGKIILTNDSGEDVGPLVVTITMKYDVSNINFWGTNISEKSYDGNTITLVLPDGIKNGSSVTIEGQISSTMGYNDASDFTIDDVSIDPQ